MFVDGVPLNTATESHGDVAEVTDGCRAMPDLDIADRQLAGLDAVQEVLVMVLADVQLHFVLFESLLDEVFRSTRDLAAIDEDRSFGTDKRHAARAILFPLADDHFHAG